jgi:hypothetical protein
LVTRIIYCEQFRSWSPQLVAVDFFIAIKSFRSHYGPGITSASNRNEYRYNLLGLKAAGA